MDYMSILAVVGPTALVTAGAAWGAAKQALNGTRDRVQVLEEARKEQVTHNLNQAERTARIETKLDTVIERLK